MNPGRRLVLHALIAAAAVRQFTSIAAENYPSRPIKIIVPSPPGGIVDVEVRRLATHLAEALGQQVIIDNRPGASNTIGTALGARAAPDGYTLTWGSTTALAVAPALMPNLPYDPLKDFEPIALYGRVPFLLVANPLLSVGDLGELTVLAKRKPGQLNYASNGPAGSLHVMGELLKATLGVDIMHVPYKGVAPALLSVLANETQLTFDFPVTAAAHIRAGKLKALLLTGRNRVPILPHVPTAREAGYPKLEVMASGGLMAPAGTPREVILRLNAAMLKIMRTPSIETHRREIGAEAGGGSPEHFRNTVAEELAKWGEIIRKTGVQLEQ